MIISGTKKEEYRILSATYCSKFLLINGKHKKRSWWLTVYVFEEDKTMERYSFELLLNRIKAGYITFKDFHGYVTFINGMTPPVLRFEIELKGIKIKGGNPDWGAVPGKKYFVLELGDIV